MKVKLFIWIFKYNTFRKFIEFLSCKNAGESGAFDIKSVIEVLKGTINLANMQIFLKKLVLNEVV